MTLNETTSPGPMRSLQAAMLSQYAVGGALIPFITLHFQDRGLDFSEIGWLFLTSSAVGVLVPLLWGYIADRAIPVHRLIMCLHGAGAIVLLVLARQSSFAGLLVTYGLFAAFFNPTGALLSALAYHTLPSPERQFGGLRLWGSIGWMLPSLPISLWLAWREGAEDPNVTFCVYLAAALGFLVVGVSFFFPSAPPVRTPLVGAGPVLPYPAALARLFRRRGFATFLTVVFLTHASFAVLIYYSPSFLEAAGFERKWIGPLQCLGVAVELPFLVVLPRVIGRVGYRITIALGCGTLFVRHALYAAAAGPVLLASSYVLAGACVAFYLTAVSLAINRMADRSLRASAQTIVFLVGSGLGQMFGHRAVGWLASRSGGGLHLSFLFAAIAAAAALALVVFGLRGKDLFDAPKEG
jgi:MFS family permease